MFFMQEKFFTSKEAAQITGCTLRQIQYWREKGIVVPVIPVWLNVIYQQLVLKLT